MSEQEQKAAATRIYLVTETTNGHGTGERLVRASSQAQAIQKVVKGRFAAEVAGVEDVLRLTKAGVEVIEGEQ